MRNRDKNKGRVDADRHIDNHDNPHEVTLEQLGVDSDKLTRLLNTLSDEDDSVDGEFYSRGEDVYFGLGEFTDNVIAYVEGEGAEASPDTYEVNQLNVSGNLAVDGGDLFGSTRPSNARQIDSSWISGESGGTGFVEDIEGTVNRISVSSESGVYTLNTPQDLHTSADFVVNTLLAKDNIIAYSNGSGAQSSEDTYSVGQLNVSSNIAFKTVDVFNASDKIKEQFLPDGVTEGGVTSFNTRKGDVMPQSGDYDDFYVPIGRTLTMNGTENQVNVSTESQSLHENRTWSFSTPQDIDTDADVEFGSGTFHRNVIAYSQGNGAESSPDTYSVNQLNVGGNIAFKTTDIFDASDIIKEQFLPDIATDGGVTSFGPNNRTGDVNPESGDYDDFYASITHTHDGRYYTESEINNFFSGSSSISGYNKSNWDTAFGWGDHSNEGYIKTETDPVFSSSVASGITSSDVNNWDTAFINYITGHSAPNGGDGNLTLNKNNVSDMLIDLTHDHEEYAEEGTAVSFARVTLTSDTNPSLHLNNISPTISGGNTNNPMRFFHDVNGSPSGNNSFEFYTGLTSNNTSGSIVRIVDNGNVEANDFVLT